MATGPVPRKSLSFRCPYCTEVLRIPSEYLGMKGRCNRCGHSIALIGDIHIATIQQASKVETDVAPGDAPIPPATVKQLDYLRSMGVPEAKMTALNVETASMLIDMLQRQRQQGEAPSAKQLAYLEALGATAEQLAAVQNKADASELIEALHLKPTPPQIDYLRTLGASGADIARLKTKAEASVLIDQLKQADTDAS